MKKYLSYLIIATFLSFPTGSFAAYNDVSLTTDVVITVGGFDVNVSGSSAVIESISVGTSSFDVTLLSGSTFTVTSLDKKHFTVSTIPTLSYTESCPSTTSSLTFAAPSTSVVATVSISGTCVVVDTTPPVVHGGGGGSIYYNPPTPLPVLPRMPTPVSGSGTSSSIFPLLVKPLVRGMTGQNIKQIQTLLRVETSILSETDINGIFGPKTEKAVKEFQCKYKIVCSGTPNTTGWGSVGVKTLKVINSLSPKIYATTPPVTATTSPTASPMGTVSKTLSLGAQGKDVMVLQTILLKVIPESFANKDFAGFYGTKTQAAVRAFQCKYKIVCSGTPNTTGWGSVGKKTLLKINELSQ